MKKLIYFLFFVLLLSQVSAVYIEEGTILDPTGLNLSAVLGQNHTIKELVVFNTGFGMTPYNVSTGNNITFRLIDGGVINITSLNYTTTETDFTLNNTQTYEMSWEMLINGSDLNVEFNFTYNYGYLSAYQNEILVVSTYERNVTLNITNATQPVRFVNFYEDMWECDGRAGETVLFNFSLHDEDTFLALVGDIYVDLDYRDTVLSFQKSNVSSLAICVGGERNYTVTGVVQNNVAYSNKHFINNAVLQASQLQIWLYNYNDTTGKSTLEWTVRDEAWDIRTNVIGYLQRYYPANHSWYTIQQDKSGEFGRLVYHIQEEDIEYRMRFYDESLSTLMDSTEAIKFVCTDSLCQVTSQILDSEATSVDIGATWDFDNETRILTIEWDDVTGATSHVNISLVRSTMTGNSLICEQTVFSSTGSYECNTTGHTGSALLTIRSSASPEVIYAKTIIELLGVPRLADFLGNAEGAVWSLGLSLTMVGMALTGSPIAVLLMLVASLIIESMLGITSMLTVGILGLFFTIAIIIAFIIKQ